MQLAGLKKTWSYVCVTLTITLMLVFTVQAGNLCDVNDPEFEKDILAKYPGLFKTREEKEAMEKAFIEQMQPELTSGYEVEEVNVSGGESTTINHACCESTTSLIDHEFMRNISGKKVRIVQLPNRKQFFHTETCEEVDGCDLCSCHMRSITFTALYFIDNPGSPESECTYGLVKALAVCRCLNVGYNYNFEPQRSEL